MDKLGIVLILISLGQVVINEGSEKEDNRNAIFRELVEIWRKGGGWNPHKIQPSSERHQDKKIHPIVRNIMGGLKSLGFLPRRNTGLPSLNKAFDRNRLSGFLYNISMYLQEVSAELDDGQQPFSDDQLWENLLYTLLQTGRETSFGLWDGKTPRPTFRLQDLFLSIRGSPHWDGILGLIQSILTLTERQPQKPILTFVSQNWKTISALLETVIQALVSGTYSQAVAGLQGFICVLKGRNDCAIKLSWLQHFLSFMETRHWKPVVSLHPVSMENYQRDAALSTGRFKPFLVPPEVLRQEQLLLNQTGTNSESLASMQALLLQALSRSNAGERAVQFAERNPALLQGLDNLRRGLLHNVGRSVYGNLRRKVSHMTRALLDDVSTMVGEPQYSDHGRCSVGDLRQLILWGIKHNLTWNAQAMGFHSDGLPSRPSFMSCPTSDGRKRTVKQQPLSRGSRQHQYKPNVHEHGDLDHYPSDEILEAACNASIPGLTGVSNFTVFLYCNLFDGKDGSQDPEVSHFGLDLHTTCSDAAWYLSAAEQDFLWVHVCSEFFTHEFNKTVCANSTFWLQHAHQAEATKDYQYINQTSIDELCLQLSADVSGGSHADATENCLALLSSKTITAHNFRKCFLPNNTALIASLCSNESSQVAQDGRWASEYCSKVNHILSKDRLCDYSNWKTEQFINSTTLELCRSNAGLKDYICKNNTLYLMLVRKQPSLFEFCLNSEEKLGRKCVLQQLFDMLPAPYDFDTSQLCVNPLPILQEAIQNLTLCEGVVDERTGWLATVSYVLRVLDYVVGLSSGWEDGERDVRQGLGQAILLSSLQDNSSFWTTLRPDAPLSVLQTVGIFLKREQNSSLKEDLLSCFSQPVLWDLIQREGNSSALKFLMQEYLQMPKESIRSVVLSAEKDAVKRFLSHVHQSWDQLQVETIQVSSKEQEAMETMTAAFIHKFPRVTPELFIDLSQFIPYMSVSDILTFPASLMVNESVLMAISDYSSEMKSPQKQAFVKRLLQSNVAGDVPSWPPYFLRSILPLLPYLPVSHFQQLTSQQLYPLMEMLGNSSLDAIRGRHVLRTVFNRGKNLTSDTIIRLGVLICYLNSEDLRQLLSSATLSSTLLQHLARCVSEGHVSGSGRLSHWLGMALKSLNSSVLSASAMASLHGILPQMGTSFLEKLSLVELLNLVTLPDMPTFPPAQAFWILNKIAEETNFSANTLCRLKPLFSGLGPSVLKKLVLPESTGTADCQCWSQLLSDLQPAHRTMVHLALQQALEHTSANITQRLQCLLPFVSLKKLMSDLDGETVLHHIYLYKYMPWSHQQAQMLFKMIHRTVNITRDSILDLGRIAGGMTCEWLKLWVNDSGFTELLQFITKLPGGLRPALRTCIVVELRKRTDIDLNNLEPMFVANLPVTVMEHLSNSSLIRVLDYVRQHFIDFLQLPRHKQAALAEKAMDAFGISENGLTGASMDMLGPLLPFLDRDVLADVDREVLKLRLEELKQYCLPPDSFRQISALLTERSMLGEPRTWTVGDVEHLGRLVFTLSPQQIRSLPLRDLGKDTVEQVLMSQWLWKESEVGKACLDLKGLPEKINSLIYKIVKGRWWTRRGPIPSCADIKGTFPSAWRSYQLNRMKKRELKECVEFIGQDGTLDAEQREALWMELRPVYKPVKLLKQEQVLELGCIVTEMGERELQAVDLSNLAVVAQLGSLSGWSPKKIRATVLGIMRRLKQKPEELGVVELVSFRHLLCGLSSSEIARLDSFNLSVAALFLREMVLPCSEQQTNMLTSRLSNPLGFGPVSSWGSEVFTEIGTLAAGLDDMVLSALVKEQIEGLTPAAIALIPPRKLAVVFNAMQLSWLSSEQACAVTEEQWEELDGEQRQALGMAQYEGELMLGHRGRNQAPSLRLADSFTKCLLVLVCTLWFLLYRL